MTILMAMVMVAGIKMTMIKNEEIASAARVAGIKSHPDIVRHLVVLKRRKGAEIAPRTHPHHLHQTAAVVVVVAHLLIHPLIIKAKRDLKRDPKRNLLLVKSHHLIPTIPSLAIHNNSNSNSNK